MRSAALGVAATMAMAWITWSGWVMAQERGRPSPITDAHLARIANLFQAKGITGGRVARDRLGRIQLQGQFEDERQVDTAFSLAQTVVGVRWVSPVTPEHIKVKRWEDCLSQLLSGERCGPSSVRPAEAPPPAATPPGPVANKYALLVGIGRFKNGIQPLQFGKKDASDVYAYLVDPTKGAFKTDNVILLRDEYATREGVVRAFDAIRRRARADDLVLIYLSSHGTPPDKFGGVHVVTHDSEIAPRERIWETALTESTLRDFIQHVRAQRLIVIMDACYSNGAYGQIAGFPPQGGKSLEAGWDEGHGRSRRDMAQRLLGAKDLVVDEALSGGSLSRGWGKVLISASDAGERSWESETLRNSVFTHYLIEGLQQHGGAVKEAFEYAKPRVHARVKQEKGAEIEQNPQITPNRRDWHMSVAVADR